MAAPRAGLLAVSLSLRLKPATNFSLRVELARLFALPRVRCDRRLGRRQMDDVIESCKYHQHQDDREADAKSHFLGPFGKRTAPYALDQIEQKVTAIEQRDGKQV